MASCLPLLAILLYFSFSVEPQSLYYNSTAIAPTSWINSPAIPLSTNYSDGSSVRALLLRLNPAGFGPSFAAGFYCFYPCKSVFFSIFIVYAIRDERGLWYPIPQVIWSANRAHPISENATLQLTSQSGLTLHDGDGSLIWTTDIGNQSVAGINITEFGNLVLFDINNSPIWQSWEHPTDSLVMGQSLAGGQRLTASSSRTNWTEGRLYLILLAGGIFAFVNSNPPQLYYNISSNISNRSVDKSAFLTLGNGSLYMNSSLFKPNERIVLKGFVGARNIQYIRLEYDGHLRLYDFDSSTGQWILLGDLFTEDYCAYPTFCGHYGICNNGQCTCPAETSGNYFKLVDDRQPQLGCSTVTPITCEDVNNHELLTISNVSYPNYVDDVAFSRIDEDRCKKDCLENCSCKAVVYRYFDKNVSDGRCFMLSEVFSFENYKSESPYTNSSAYIKVQVAPSPPHSRGGLGKILVFTFGTLLCLLALISIYLVCLRKVEETQDSEEAEDEDFNIDQLPGMPTRFSFEELREATENFTKKLGEGGFGTVFEGSWSNERIAVKRLKNTEQARKDFLVEVVAIGRIHHINLVRLTGYCVDRVNRLLVYEYMCNGSLDQWISCNEWREPLDWSTRLKIITGIAKGLCYLQEDCRQKILHFDIKPENILLDEKFNAKISDFGLSKLIDREMSRVMTLQMRGTLGYMAPEWWITGEVSEKVDVYSYGVVVMEILCGRRNIDCSQTKENQHLLVLLEQKAKSNELLDLIDKNIGDVNSYEGEIMNIMQLAMWCLQLDSSRRPSMSAVVKVLERVMVVETSLSYNFIPSIPTITCAVGQVDQSAALLASTSRVQDQIP
ncbi:Serine/threonine-protein kinase [Rhynchospora pubera]|uniref:Receptor-like serine/threonine-protein kinase n=1 Tax=Rhynchospora pubera TaxID=906938 RepID=A0AAV8DLW9_9POAL|nr:Serine/threonine-protein kinase [Rhynchospora pubera]KAJ4820691.1 Serine/threonine-protein kinase [Rhynchospora pubera]